MLEKTLDYKSLNAMLNLYSDEGKLQLDKDKEATRRYFLDHVNQNTIFFHSVEEKLSYLVENGYYQVEVLNNYSDSFIKDLFKRAYAYKFRFKSFLGAYKFYTSYAMTNLEGDRYLERYEDRVVMVALTLADGDEELAINILDEIISGRLQPATPTFLSAGKVRSGAMVSCFLIQSGDSLESMADVIKSSMQLSKRGGGVGICLTNIREQGAPIKGIQGVGSGLIPFMKTLENTFQHINQIGQRQGAGAVYVNVHHPDILSCLDTRRENADSAVRIKSLSIGVVIPDITFELAKNNDDMYLFSPYDVERVYGVPMTDISISEKYHEMVENKEIRKKKIKARLLFQTIAELQFESGYPYILFEDNANRGNPLEGRITMSNLCSEILQVQTQSTYNEQGDHVEIGRDISCNLASLNIALALDGGDLEKTVEVATRALTTVSDKGGITAVRTVKKGNELTHSIGLGQMNLHGFLARELIHYGDEDSLEFASVYSAAINYFSLKASTKIAQERGETFFEFEKSTYADGSYFDQYLNRDWLPKREKVKDIFESRGISLPTPEDWRRLKEEVMKFGLYHGYRLAIPPTGSISYLNNSTSSIHPIISPIEVRKEGKIGRVYYPAPHLSDENMKYFQSAFDVGPEKLIDMYARFQEHTDQGLSLTLFFSADSTTRDLSRAYIYAFKKGIKTLYYTRIRQQALEGTEVEGCVSCAL